MKKTPCRTRVGDPWTAELTPTEKDHAWNDMKSLVSGDARDWGRALLPNGRMNRERRRALITILRAISKVRRPR